ncbi:hypothetical protein ACH4VR_23315 [Streptomyces sp. NPDC020883]|uniref:hypothetical protein n=1 Tax=Streptomyces sp. NPDC020883 TaxID=3365099 RepID=UPI003795023A
MGSTPTGARRTTLAALTDHWPTPSPASGLEPTDADTPLTLPVPPQPPAAPKARP